MEGKKKNNAKFIGHYVRPRTHNVRVHALCSHQHSYHTDTPPSLADRGIHIHSHELEQEVKEQAQIEFANSPKRRRSRSSGVNTRELKKTDLAHNLNCSISSPYKKKHEGSWNK